MPVRNGTSGSTRGPSVFGGGGVANWEITDFPKCKICVLGSKPSVDICTKLMRSFIEVMRFHESQNLTELSDGKCVYISSIGPPSKQMKRFFWPLNFQFFILLNVQTTLFLSRDLLKDTTSHLHPTCLFCGKSNRNSK